MEKRIVAKVSGDGRRMEKARLQRMEAEAIRELLHYYDKDAKRKWKDRLKKAALRYVPPDDGIFWDTGLLANGLSKRLHDGKGAREEILAGLRQYFDRWIGKGMPVFYLDDTLCGVALLRLYEATREAKYKAGADRLAGYLLSLGEKEADGAGSIPYRPAQKNGHIYVDGIGMMCPFLTMYGVKYGNRAAVDLALTQVKNMLAYGMDAKKGLPYHGFQYEKREKCGIIGWGRAVGWLLMGLQGALYWLREGDAADREEGGFGWTGHGQAAQEYCGEYEELRKAFLGLLEAVKPYQREDGGFSWQLEAMEGPADSSATAMIARAVQFAVECGWTDAVKSGAIYKEKDAREMLRDAALFLEDSEKEGRIYRCLGECLGFSQHPQAYGAYPWALGVALEVLDSGRETTAQIGKENG